MVPRCPEAEDSCACTRNTLSKLRRCSLLDTPDQLQPNIGSFTDPGIRSRSLMHTRLSDASIKESVGTHILVTAAMGPIDTMLPRCTAIVMALYRAAPQLSGQKNRSGEHGNKHANHQPICAHTHYTTTTTTATIHNTSLHFPMLVPPENYWR